ncbi:MAG: electron transfer flavoprotein subunit beta/FixA family protein [Chlorobi bacterium]|nr:electron transfer flavoprotein subunit beta/FixA family protein [Chlorobiota bacterium]
MRILVCISHVPDTTAKISFTDDKLEYKKDDIQFIIGPYEELSLTRALELKETVGNITITAINVGFSDTEPTLRKALAIGADDAIRINADPKDAYFVAKQIAEAVKNESFDIVLTGKESINYNGAQVSEMLAEFLQIPSITSASKVEISGDKAIVEREIDGGKEQIETSFPFVASGQKGIAFEPRIPNMRGIMMARKKPLKVIEPVECEELTTITMHELPPPKAACKMVDADNVEELVHLLHDEAKII